jgi:hypothetical protein
LGGWQKRRGFQTLSVEKRKRKFRGDGEESDQNGLGEEFTPLLPIVSQGVLPILAGSLKKARHRWSSVDSTSPRRAANSYRRPAIGE